MGRCHGRQWAGTTPPLVLEHLRCPAAGDIPRFGMSRSTFPYCLSKINVWATGLPSASVPLEVCVNVLPSFEMTVRPVKWYFAPVFLTSQLVVFASIRLTEMVSNGPPVAADSFPSYL